MKKLAFLLSYSIVVFHGAMLARTVKSARMLDGGKIETGAGSSVAATDVRKLLVFNSARRVAVTLPASSLTENAGTASVQQSAPRGSAGDQQSRSRSGAPQANNVNDNGSRVAVAVSAQFAGRDPWIDIRAFGARANNGGFTGPQTTATISAGSPNAKLANGSQFQNGDNIAIPGAGATLSILTPGAPAVRPSITRFASGVNITVADGGTGATTYCYSIVARTTDGQLTPAGTETCTTTGQANLGPVTPIKISSYTRSGKTVTVTTASAHTLVPNAMVRIRGADTSIAGNWNVVTVPDNTHFTITTATDTAAGGLASGGATGTVTWYNVNHISWSSVAGAFQYYIYGRVSGRTKTRIGTSYPDNPPFAGFPTYNTWDDYGATAMGPAPAAPPWVPSTVPSVGQNGILTTSILRGGGTNNVVLANNAVNAVAGATFNLDNGPALKAAAMFAQGSSSGNGVVYIPVGSFPIYSFVSLPNANTVSIAAAGQLTLGDTIFAGGLIYNGRTIHNPASPASFDFMAMPRITGITAYPMIYSAGANVYLSYVSLFNNSLNGIAFLQDNGLIPASSFDHVQIHTGLSPANDYLGLGVVLRGNNPTGGSSNWNFTDCVFAAGLNNNVISDTPLFYSSVTGMPFHFNNVQFAVRGMAFDTGQNGAQIIIDNLYNQGPDGPLVSIFSTQASFPVFQVENRGAIVDSALQPVISYFGPASGSIALSNVVGSGAVIGVQGPGGVGVITRGTTAGFSGTGYEFGPAVLSSVDGFNSHDNLSNPIKRFAAHVMAGANNEFFINSLATAAPSCSVSAGGNVPRNTYQFVVAPVFATRGEGAPSAPSAFCTTTSGNQTVTLNWTKVPGAVGYNIYIPNLPTSFQVSGQSPFINAGSTTSFVWTNQATIGEAVSSPGGGPSIMNRAGLYGNSFNLPGLDGSSVNGVVTIDAPVATAARAQHLPNASGNFLLDSTIASSAPSAPAPFDNFNRANGALGSNWTSNYSGNGSMAISGNTVIGGSGSANTNSYWNATPFSNDQYAEATIAATGANQQGVSLRNSGTTNATTHAYLCVENATTLQIFKVVAGAAAPLGSTAVTGAAGDRIRATVQGTSIICHSTSVSGVTTTVSATDSAVISGAPGIIAARNTGGMVNWTGGSLPSNVAYVTGEQQFTGTQHILGGALVIGAEPATSSGGLTKGTVYAQAVRIGNAGSQLPAAVTVASGTATLGTSAIASGTCAPVVTVSAAGVATTDVISSTFDSDPTLLTGYGPSASGSLYITSFPTANNVNFYVCNNTAGSIRPGAATLNWRVTR